MVAGVIVTVRLVPLPAKRMAAFGTSCRFDDVPVTTRLTAGVSASLMVKATIFGVSSLVD